MDGGWSVQTCPPFEKLDLPVGSVSWEILFNNRIRAANQNQPTDRNIESLFLKKRWLLITAVGNNHITLVQSINLMHILKPASSWFCSRNVYNCNCAEWRRSPFMKKESFPRCFSTSVYHCCRLPPAPALFFYPLFDWRGGSPRKLLVMTAVRTSTVLNCSYLIPCD